MDTSIGRYFEFSMYDEIRPAPRPGDPPPRATGRFQCPLCQCTSAPRNSPMARQFGLLDGCPHAFCLFCIREYRRTLLRTSRDCVRFEPGPAPCPVCQAPFRTIMASARWIRDPREKAAFLESHRAGVEGLPCSFLRRGMGRGLCDKSCERGGSLAGEDSVRNAAAKNYYVRTVRRVVSADRDAVASRVNILSYLLGRLAFDSKM